MMHQLWRSKTAAFIGLSVACVSVLPEGAIDPAEARLKAAPVRVEFRLAQEIPEAAWQRYRSPDEDLTIYVADRVELSNADFEIVDAFVVPGGVGLELSFTEPGQRRFATLTGQNIDRRLAIFIDGTLIGAPIIKAALSGSTPLFVRARVSPAEAARIVTAVSGK